MELELGQTICTKEDEDLENCPLQEGPEEKKVWEYDEHSCKGVWMERGLGKLSGMILGKKKSWPFRSQGSPWGEYGYSRATELLRPTEPCAHSWPV